MTDQERIETEKVTQIHDRVNLSVRLLQTLLVGAVMGAFGFGVWITNVSNTMDRLAESGEGREHRLQHVEQTYFRRDDIAALVNEFYKGANR